VKFKEIAAAYEVLSDADKRSHYDRFGEYDSNQAGGHGGFNMHEVDPFEIFQAFFGGAGGHPDMFGNMGFGGGGIHFAHNFGGPGMRLRMGGQRHRPHSSQTVRLEIKLEDLFKGAKKRVNNEEIEIVRGMKEGDRIRGRGAEYIVVEAPHANFTRRGDNLEYTAVVSFYEWLFHGKPNFKLLHLDGSTLNMTLRAFTETLLMASAIVKGKGMPTNASASLYGDLLVYSSFLTKADRESVKALGRAFGMVLMFMVMMWNPSLLFLFVLLKPLFA
jgi:DnaJ-class molecular chaperone